MIVFHHPSHRLHDPTENHVFAGRSLPPAEVAERADRILGNLDGFQIDAPAPLDTDLLADVHHPDYLRFLETAHSRWRAATGAPASGEAVAYIRPLPDTPWNEPDHVLAQLGRYSNDVDPILEGTWEAALASAACAVAAAEAVTSGADGAYGLCRPPGHHAAPGTFGGYCYLNNAALAAARLRREGGRVAILDLDTHHGNGTQTVFWDRSDVLTVSIHGDTTEHYPFFLGHADERGGPQAEGANLNLPLPTGTGWEGYREALTDAAAAIRGFAPDWLVVPLGVDTHTAHGVLALEGEDYNRLGERIAALGLPTVLVQEGGYAPGCLEEAVPAVLASFRGT
ncbi:MAG: histone deacetylase family protein [Actinomycetota bacterium]